MPENRQPGKLAVILHADIAGSTTLVQQDEHLAHERIQDTFQRFREAIDKYHGRVRELRGDALLAEFERASDAVSATLAFQAEQAEYIAKLNDNIRPTVRVGLAMGEVIIADNTVTGAGVVLAQRIEQLAEPGGVCITGAIHEALPQRMPFNLNNLGEQELKGFDEQVRVYTVSLNPGTKLPEPETLPRVEVEVPSLPNKPSIAVLPFDNMSDDPQQEYFSDGITEDIITALSKISKLFVVARNSTFTYKGKAVDVKQVGREQGVRYVLEGSVRRSGDRLRITAQLIDATAGHHLWAQRYDRVVQDVFELQDEITREVTSALQIELTDGEQAHLWASGTKNLQAWEIVIQIPELLDSHRKENMTKGRRMAEQALKLDENYAAAWTLLGWLHWEEVFNGWSKTPDLSLDLAMDAAQQSVSIDNANPVTVVLMAMINLSRRDFSRAGDLAERAMELGPNNSFVIGVAGQVSLYCNRPRDLLALLKKAKRLCPIHPAWFSGDTAWAYLLLDRREDVIVTAQTSIGIDPDYPYNYIVLAVAFAELNRELEAQKAVENLLRIDRTYTVSTFAECQPFRDIDVLDRHIEGLRKAGLPE